MIPDTFATPSRAPRAFKRLRQKSRFRALQPATESWQIKELVLQDPSGQRYKLVRHGADRHTVSQVVATSIVLHGDFPVLNDITGDQAQLQHLLSEIRTTGSLFTVYASLYRRGTQTVVLLDYLR